MSAQLTTSATCTHLLRNGLPQSRRRGNRKNADIPLHTALPTRAARHKCRPQHDSTVSPSLLDSSCSSNLPRLPPNRNPLPISNLRIIPPKPRSEKPTDAVRGLPLSLSRYSSYLSLDTPLIPLSILLLSPLL